MLEILKEVTHAIINNPITCLVFYFLSCLLCCRVCAYVIGFFL